jgi:hypothetical protein
MCWDERNPYFEDKILVMTWSYTVDAFTLASLYLTPY